MKWLCGHTMQGVEHCSDAREPPPCCHPQTRSALLTEANDWLRAQNSKLRVSLLCGPAGVGKSAIAQTLADCAASENRLGATIFFTNSSSARRERSKLWTTISYLLAVNHLPYSQHVQREIGRNLRLVEHNMKKQFDALIEIPIGRQKLLAGASHLIPIFIDGLDQFCDPGDREEVVQLILDFVEKHPDAPLAWIITSSSGEYLIKAIDQKVTAQECFQKCLLEIDSPDARKDVRHFLESRFGEIQDQYGIPKPPQWPNKERLDDVSAKASGFFIFAHAVTQFVGDRKAKDPEGRLGVVLQTVPGRGDPLGAVHEMYREILSNVSEEHRSVVKRILGLYCLPRGFGSWRQDTTTFWALCNILGITWQDGDGCLSGLHSLLDIPTIEDAAFQPIRLFHSSFTEYLTSSNCPADFHIDMKEVVSELWQCHFRVMQNAQVPGIFVFISAWNFSFHLALIGRSTIQLSNIPLSWALSPEQDQNLRRKMWENARRLFFHYILPCDPLLGCPFGLHPSNVEDLSGILREVRFDNLVDGYAFPDLPFKFLEFLDWIAQEVGVNDIFLRILTVVCSVGEFIPSTRRPPETVNYGGSTIWLGSARYGVLQSVYGHTFKLRSERSCDFIHNLCGTGIRSSSLSSLL